MSKYQNVEIATSLTITITIAIIAKPDFCRIMEPLYIFNLIAKISGVVHILPYPTLNLKFELKSLLCI